MFGLFWGTVQVFSIFNTNFTSDDLEVDEKADATDEHNNKVEVTKTFVEKTMRDVNQTIKDGADTFLAQEYTYLTVFCVVFAIIIVCAVDAPWAVKEDGSKQAFPFTTVAFLIGAGTSMLCGLIGMKIAT